MIGTELNLVSRERLRAQRWNSSLQWSLPFLLVGVLLLAVGAYQHHKAFSVVEHQLRILRSQSEPPSKLPKVTKGRQKKQQREVAWVNQRINEIGFSWEDLLSRLEQTLTEGISLRSIRPHIQDRTVRLEGKALNQTALQVYLAGLLDSDNFPETDLLSHAIETKPQEGPAHIRFTLTLKEAF